MKSFLILIIVFFALSCSEEKINNNKSLIIGEWYGELVGNAMTLVFDSSKVKIHIWAEGQKFTRKYSFASENEIKIDGIDEANIIEVLDESTLKFKKLADKDYPKGKVSVLHRIEFIKVENKEKNKSEQTEKSK